MPPLEGATEWLNSEPLGPAALRGHVVLLNFWTLTCINWLRQEPYVRAWSQAYRADGLVVIGVHTPEFSFEHEIDRVREATKERGIDYPVALDNDYEIWSAFDNHYWPALYFVDADGTIRDQHFGEGRYEESEHVIQRLLGVERDVVSVEGLGVDHLRLVMGTSMGGMHTWMWGYMYPSMMDGLVPLASVPTQIAGRNRVMRKMISDSIRNDPAWQGGAYTTQPERGLTSALNILLWMTSSPLQWQKQAATRDAADAFYAQQIARRLSSTDANDMLYQFESSADYDPSPHLEQITAPVLAINSADDQVNPPELGLMEQLIARVKHGTYMLLPITNETRGHGTHSLPAIWGEHLRKFLGMLP